MLPTARLRFFAALPATTLQSLMRCVMPSDNSMSGRADSDSSGSSRDFDADISGHRFSRVGGA
jgi:hypothetical protein